MTKKSREIKKSSKNKNKMRFWPNFQNKTETEKEVTA
jgi:hypothetical protein